MVGYEMNWRSTAERQPGQGGEDVCNVARWRWPCEEEGGDVGVPSCGFVSCSVNVGVVDDPTGAVCVGRR